MQSEPHGARTMVWAPPVSLAATSGIDVSFFSSGYLDASVHRVPLRTLWIGVRIHEVRSCGFPHSEICGSMDMCSSPQLFAAYHVFHRLLVPRHPPCALIGLTFCRTSGAFAPFVRRMHSVACLYGFGSLNFVKNSFNKNSCVSLCSLPFKITSSDVLY